MEDDILIDNYFKGLLSEDEKKSFLERLSTDALFYEKFELEGQLINSLSDDGWDLSKVPNEEVKAYSDLLKKEELLKLKRTLSDVNSKFNEKKSNSTRKLLYYSVAACIIALLGLQLFFNQNISNQELYYDNIGLNDLPSFISRSDESNPLVNAQELFENKKYEEALLIFKYEVGSKDVSANVLIYKGIAETELGQYNDAQETFDSLLNSNLLDAQKGYWYKALLYIKQNRVEESKVILSKIVSQELYKNNEAQKLLKQLD